MPLRENLLTPIAGPNPSGSDLRYDPVLDKIKEARREELEAPQGAWKTAVKVADYAQVIQLSGEALATRSKHLQLAVWLVDAHVRREGFIVVPACLRFLRELCESFWDTLYPGVEDGDLEMRAAPLEWLGSRLDQPLRLLPITTNGLNWFKYKESRAVGYETDADTNEKRKAREQAIEDGKITAEIFDQAVDETSREACIARLAAIEESQQELEKLIALLDEKFSDFSPSFLPVRKALEENAQTLRSFVAKKGGAPQPVAPQPAPAPVAAPQPVATEAPTPVAPVTPVAPPAPASHPAAQTSSYEPADVEDAARRIAATARYLRGRDVYDISPYLILRGFRWGEIRYNGPEIDRNMLAPPSDEIRTGLERSFSSARWDEVLALTEEAMELPCGRAWLDLQRYTVKALEAKGEWFAFVANAVRGSLRVLVQDLPALPDLFLRDGSPAADQTTREWIATQVLNGAVVTPSLSPAPIAPPPPAPAAPAPSEPLEPLSPSAQLATSGLSDDANDAVFDQALRCAQAGQVSEALHSLGQQLSMERSGRGRFKRRVQLAHLLLTAGRERIAQPLLDEVALEIEQRKLAEWEHGEALAYPLSLLLRCADADPEKRQRLYAAICRLDPVRALQLQV